MALATSLPQLPDTRNEFDFLSEIAEKFLESNPRRIKRMLNTYRYVKILANAQDEPVQTSKWQQTMLAWLAFTMRWPSFMAEAIERANSLVTSEESHEAFLLQVRERIKSETPMPDASDIKKYLPIDGRQIKKFWELAGNFLIENPKPQVTTESYGQ